MKRVFVTGARGFLGRELVSLLLSRHPDVSILSPSSTQLNLLSAGGIRAYMHAYQPDTVIHLAAAVGGIQDNINNPARFIAENLVMGLNLLEACTRNPVKKFVMVGTTCMYPVSAGCWNEPIIESDLWQGHPAAETAPYGVAKLALLEACQSYRKQHGLNFAFLIPSNLYGPGDKSSHVVPDLVRKFCTQDEVEVWGDGRQTRDLLYVRDCAHAILAAAQKMDTPFPMNVSSGVGTEIGALAHMIRSLSGSNARVVFRIDKPTGHVYRTVSNSRAVNTLGWKPQVSLLDGLAATINAFKHEHTN